MVKRLCNNTHTHTRTKITRHYIHRFDTQWANSEQGRDFHPILPHFSPSISWTQGLSRREAALVAQFLAAHFATFAYLFRFGHRGTCKCPWCGCPLASREHLVLWCPHFEYVRQTLSLEITRDTRGNFQWTWDYLVGDGRFYLAKFLRTFTSSLSLC